MAGWDHAGFVGCCEPRSGVIMLPSLLALMKEDPDGQVDIVCTKLPAR